MTSSEQRQLAIRALQRLQRVTIEETLALQALRSSDHVVMAATSWLRICADGITRALHTIETRMRELEATERKPD